MTTFLLANPAAGGGRAGRILPDIFDGARLWWPDLTLATTTAPGEAGSLARNAAVNGARLIIVVGGDGTVHEAANGILALPEQNRPRLGVVPIGTGNDFARLIGTARKNPRDALALLAHGRPLSFDVGRAWDEYFVNSVGLGFDAAVASRVPGFRHLWRPLVYPAALASSYFKFRPVSTRLVSDTLALDEPLFCVEVAIGVAAGGGFYLTPDARPDDGVFDVCVVRPLGHWGFVTRMPYAFWGGHVRFKQVTMLRTSRISVTTARPLLAHFDGEIRHNGSTEIVIDLVPGALPVLTGPK